MVDRRQLRGKKGQQHYNQITRFNPRARTGRDPKAASIFMIGVVSVPDLDVPVEVISLAMAIEAQAMDLYQRAAERAQNEQSRAMLKQIADEERGHLNQLGSLLETL